MKLPNSEYFKNLKPCITPWTAIATTVRGKKYPMGVISAMFKKYMVKEDYQQREKDALLENLFAMSHGTKLRKEVSENPLFHKESENQNALD